MANSAFDHSPSITVPGSSTNTALVRWSGTGGTTFLDSTIIVGATTMGLAADTDLLTFGTDTLAIAGAITGVTTITATTFSGALSGNASGSAATLTNARTIGGVSFNGSVNIVPATITVADTTDTTSFVGLWESATGDLAPKTDAALTYNAGTGLLSATGVTASGTMTFGTLSDGSIGVTAWVDEDNMSSNSATLIPTQQSVKAYVDAGGARTVSPTNVDNAIITFVDSGDTFAAEANLTFDGTNLTVGTGNVIIGTAGKGIDFSNQASPAGGMTSELLDRYEEGTWTPVFKQNSDSSAFGAATEDGQYTKIGRLVYFQFRFVANSAPNSGSSAINITGFPFTSLNSTYGMGFTSINAAGLAITAGGHITGALEPNNTIAYIYVWADTTGRHAMTVDEMSADGSIWGIGFYNTA